MNKIVSFELANTGDAFRPFRILAVYANGDTLPFDKEIKTERGAKSRLTFWRKRLAKGFGQ